MSLILSVLHLLTAVWHLTSWWHCCKNEARRTGTVLGEDQCLVLGVWCLLLGVWCLVFCAWCLVFGAWCLVLGVWCLVKISGKLQAKSILATETNVQVEEGK